MNHLSKYFNGNKKWTHKINIKCTLFISIFVFQGMYIKSTYDGLHVITGTTENVSF